jgi:glycerophosphoryl diester phosphodiesterase
MLVIGHRGACGYRPEHTLASYELAGRLGADFLEPDLVITADGVLVCRHEPELSGASDVATRPEFAGRRRLKSLAGRDVDGWWAEDFTLAELKTLRARERIPDVRPANTAYDGAFEIPTYQEVLDLAARLSAELGRTIGTYPETKHPAFFRDQGLPLEPPLVALLRANGLDRPDAPVFVQSFGDNLPALRGELSCPFVQLLARPRALAPIVGYAQAVGPGKHLVLPRDGDDRSLPPTRLVDEAHALGLDVHLWTIRAENRFLPRELRSSEDPNAFGDVAAELAMARELGVEAVFADQPDLAVTPRPAAPAAPPAPG